PDREWDESRPDGGTRVDRPRAAADGAVSDSEQVAGAGVAARVTQLAHRPRLDLADALAGEVEVLADLLERARFAAIEAEAELEDLALAVVERGEQSRDLLREQRRGGNLEGRLG